MYCTSRPTGAGCPALRHLPPISVLVMLLTGSPAAHAQAHTPAPSGPQLLTINGEVGFKPGTADTDTFTPATAPRALSRRDEIQTGAGTAEVLSERGMVLELAPGTLIAIIGAESGIDAYVARGAVRVRPGPSNEVHSVQLVTSAGRMTLRGRDARLRVDGDTTTLAVTDGNANVWGKGGVLVRSGQMTQVQKGHPPAPPRPIATAEPPQWLTPDTLVILNGPRPVLRWQPVPGAQRYRVDLSREGGATVPWTVPDAQFEVPAMAVGAYTARVVPLLAGDTEGQAGEPRKVVVVSLLGLGPDNTLPAGTLPRLDTPPGLSAAITEGGADLPASGLAPGEHRLQVQIAGLGGEVTVRAAPRPAPAAEPVEWPESAPPPPPPPRVTRTGPDTSAAPFLVRGPAVAPPPPAPSIAVVTGTPLPPLPGVPPPEDLALGGPADVSGPGVRSPWAGRLVQLGGESSLRGEGRLVIGGRATLRSGLGLELGFSALRASPQTDATYGNLRAALRTPALRRPRLALQGVAGVVMPIGQSPLDGSLAEVPRGSPPVTLPPGGGWRVEAAALFGLRLGRFWLHTDQGLALRVSGGVQPGYQGGAGVQADVSARVRVVGLVQWSVNVLGVPVQAGDSPVDAGGAAGGGFEVNVPAPLGAVRVSLLGRAGLGDAGAAIYGRAFFGAQLGYRFR